MIPPSVFKDVYKIKSLRREEREGRLHYEQYEENDGAARYHQKQNENFIERPYNAAIRYSPQKNDQRLKSGAQPH